MMFRTLRHLGAAAGAAAVAARAPAYAFADGDEYKKSRLRKLDFPLAEHHYGKLRVRVLKVRRTQAHSVSEYTVQTRLFNPEYERVFTNEDNTNLVATDTQKNTVYYVAKRTTAESPEQFGIDIARHFLKEYPMLTAAEVEVKETLWQRAMIDGTPHDHGFLRQSPEQASADVRLTRENMEQPEVVSRISGLTVLKTTQCGFEGFLHDQFTLLPDTDERCLSTEVSAEWRYVPNMSGMAYDYSTVRDIIRKKIAKGIFGAAHGGIYSHSVQATIYDIGCMVLESAATVNSFTIHTPNIHYLPFHALKNFGEKFENDIFVPTNEPSGTIQCTIARHVQNVSQPAAVPVHKEVPAAKKEPTIQVNVDAIKAEIRGALINIKANACPMASRLAWHSSGTYDKRNGSGGSNGATMRFKPEIDDDANKGLSIIRDMLYPIKMRHPEISYADLWALASCSAIEFIGGPKIPLELGRTDAPDASTCPANGRLPDAHQGAAHLREVFGRMGFGDREIVALSGAHTMGRCHKVRSGFDGPWTSTPLKFNNEYFRNLMNFEWKKRQWDGEEQYEDPSGEFMMLPTDIALKTDPEFAKYAALYARDESAFFRDFADAYSKLLHLGFKKEAVGKCPKSSDNFREHAMHGSLERMQSYAPRADVHSVDQDSGRSALHKGSFWGHLHVIKYLINDCGLDPNVQDKSGDTALHDAVRFGHSEIVKFLAPITNLGLKNNDGLTPHSVAVQMDKNDIIQALKH